MRAFCAVILVWGAFVAASCARTCPPMIVNHGVHVTLASASGWAAGDYRFEASTLVCEVTLPYDGGAWNSVPCSRASDGGIVPESSIELDSTQKGLTSLRLFNLTPATPVTLEVRVLHDGAEITRQALTPSYAESEPNGLGCGVARIGTARLELP